MTIAFMTYALNFVFTVWLYYRLGTDLVNLGCWTVEKAKSVWSRTRFNRCGTLYGEYMAYRGGK